mmetsp:Transcript_18055/g.34494  ORF Transcript_18055/g.34494 Transcript_18055/m.34494 type:complete len:249 (-) Transcript_18055:228-974(-)
MGLASSALILGKSRLRVLFELDRGEVLGLLRPIVEECADLRSRSLTSEDTSKAVCSFFAFGDTSNDGASGCALLLFKIPVFWYVFFLKASWSVLQRRSLPPTLGLRDVLGEHTLVRGRRRGDMMCLEGISKDSTLSVLLAFAAILGFVRLRSVVVELGGLAGGEKAARSLSACNNGPSSLSSSEESTNRSLSMAELIPWTPGSSVFALVLASSDNNDGDLSPISFLFRDNFPPSFDSCCSFCCLRLPK